MLIDWQVTDLYLPAGFFFFSLTFLVFAVMLRFCPVVRRYVDVG